MPQAMHLVAVWPSVMTFIGHAATHSPQPHLDGGYTVFGEVTSGIEVVDRIEQNDRLLSVRVLGERASGGGAAGGPARGVN